MIKYILTFFLIILSYSCQTPTYPKIKPEPIIITPPLDTIDYMLEGEFQDDTIGQVL